MTEQPAPQTSGKILVIDDERGIRALCKDVLRRAGHQVTVAENGIVGLARADETDFDLVFCDINLPELDGLSVLPKLLDRDRPPTVILITGFPSVESAVRGMKLGARDYLAKPFTPDELRMVCQRALDEDAMRRENAQLRKELAYGQLVGRSPSMVQLYETIGKVASSNVAVLIRGESGTGKELVARALHYASQRVGKPFIPVNCGALVGALLESELFGHVRGAFTGAQQAKRGLFVAADKGTLFLDEIGELPLELQPALLRALQNGEIKPVGGERTERVEVRVISATNRDLEQAVKDGRFREDLFYRLNVITLEVPPLRERPDDIAPLARHFAEAAAQRDARARPEFSDRALSWLAEQPWPGNVRQLENTIERAVILASGQVLDIDDFATRPYEPRAPSVPGSVPGPEVIDESELLSLEEVERGHILKVLQVCQGQKTKASAILGINRSTLWKKLRKYGIE